MYRRLRAILLLIWLAGLIALSLLRLRPPGADGNDGFSTAAAMERLRFIASDRRPVGSEHHRVVREYLARQFERMGYEVSLQEAPQVDSRRGSPIELMNVVARLRGAVSGGKALMLAAHYDSVPAGPGAADDGAAVAALLEVARLLSRERLRNDLIFLITDAEERGMLGARAFVAEHPWARDVAVALNFEARGSSGPAVMFETSGRNAWLIGEYARVDPHPVCSSLAYDVYRRMPNDTDFTIFRDDGGMAGLNFAFIGGYANYHTSRDDVEHLSDRSLRHVGRQALALARRLGEVDLSGGRASGDVVYFDVLSWAVVRYPARWAPWIGLLAGGLSIAVVAMLVRAGAIRGWALAAGLGLFAMTLLAGAGAAWGAWRLLRSTAIEQHEAIGVAGFTVLSVGITAAIFRLQRWVAADELGASGVLVWAALAAAGGWISPGASYALAWPAVSVSIGMVPLLRAGGEQEPISPGMGRGRVAADAIMLICTIPAIVLLAPLVYLVFLGLTLRAAPIGAALAVLVAWVLGRPIAILVGKR